MRQESKIARHYNIFKDLFQNGYFVPLVDLEVDFASKDSQKDGRVFYGNKMPASLVRLQFGPRFGRRQAVDRLSLFQCQSRPSLRINDVLNYQGSPDSKPFQTLLFMNLDGNFKNSQNEALLWMV